MPVDLVIESWPVDRPKPYAANARKLSNRAVSTVAASLREYGWRQPIVVDDADVVIVGHTRLKAAQSLGLQTVPVHVARDLTPAQVAGYRLMDNRSGEETDWDKALLGAEIESLELQKFDLTLTGFSKEELKEIAALGIAMKQGLTDDDAVPGLPEADPVSATGDVWLCGVHRVSCGDSTSLDAVQALMAGELADLIVTDPPYNVAYEGKTKEKLTIQNDSMSGEKFFDFLLAVYSNLFAVSAPGGGIYVFHADTEGMNLRKAMTDAGFKLAQCCIWVKQTMVMGRQDYHWQHEPVLFGVKEEAPSIGYESAHETALYGWKPTAAHRWFSDRRQTTVWNFDRPKRNAEHPTMKPVDLIEYPITNSSLAGHVVLDLFGGSGSTMIACEKTGRFARLMELDRKYCDVIVRRWQEFTGRTATLEGDGRTFDEMKASRLQQ